MRNSAIILAALLTATPTLAAEQCLEVKPNLNIDPAMQPTYAKYADTAHCFLRIDGKVIINRTCHIGISGDTREWAMNGVAEVYMNHDLSDRPFYARFQRQQPTRLTAREVEQIRDLAQDLPALWQAATATTSIQTVS